MDITEALVIEVRCPSCGQTYDVSVANVLKSQQMLNEECCCRGEQECPPLYLSSLLDQGDLGRLRQAWQDLERQASAFGCKLLVRPSGTD